MQERLGHRRLVCALNPAWSQMEDIYERQVREVVPYSPK